LPISIAILAHVDAGKTTLSEQILYRAGTIRTLGRVDRQNAFLDFGTAERERGITVFAAQSEFCWKGREFHLIDTPGHADFSGEMERSLQAADGAVLVISAVEGVQSHTETVWKLLRNRQIPTIFFLNKLDRIGADPERVIQEIRKILGAECADFAGSCQSGNFSEELCEQIASLDDNLLEQYLEGNAAPEDFADTARKLIAAGKLFPLYRGTALTGEGVEDLLDGLACWLPEMDASPDDPPRALAYQVRHDKQGGRVVYLKVEQGTLRPRQELTVCGQDGELHSEKIGELRRYNGPKFSPISEAKPGELCAVTGLSLMPGQIAGEGAGENSSFSMQPLLSAELLFDEDQYHPLTVLGWMRELEDEEPLLGIEWNEEMKKISVHIMGEIQLEILTGILEERYGIPVRFGECQILYRETIAAPIVGYGHFEPLRHYAEVHLRLEPAEPGSGISFASECRTDDLSANWQNLIRTHVFEKEHRGVLTGSPLTDVKIVLLSGRAHLKHTEGGDFREATYRAIRQGLMRAQSVLLEPWYAFSVEVEASLSGRVIADIQRMVGECQPPETLGETVRITGFAPVAGLRGYARELTAFSRGKGRLSLQFDRYRPCKNAAEVIEERHYNPERDGENSPDSVFCSHGAGFPVKWSEAERFMHLPL
jgi:ribosomal protection tetracycline resistance protein